MGRGRNLESGNQEIRKEDKSLTRESRKGGKQEKRIRVRKEEEGAEVQRGGQWILVNGQWAMGKEEGEDDKKEDEDEGPAVVPQLRDYGVAGMDEG